MTTSDGIYLLEDDDDLAVEIVAAFAQEGLAVLPIRDEDELREIARAGSAAVLVMDRMIDGSDSLALVEELRSAHDPVPILVISSLKSTDERIRGLRAGGDDYLVKPFAMGELIARVQALLRRSRQQKRTQLTVGPLVLDLVDRKVHRGGREIRLQPREFELLVYLARHANQVVTRAMVLKDVWNYDISVMTNVVDVYVGNVRRKIDDGEDRKLLVTVKGVGFTLSNRE